MQVIKTIGLLVCMSVECISIYCQSDQIDVQKNADISNSATCTSFFAVCISVPSPVRFGGSSIGLGEGLANKGASMSSGTITSDECCI